MTEHSDAASSSLYYPKTSNNNMKCLMALTHQGLLARPSVLAMTSDQALCCCCCFVLFNKK
jgi:hypothetical protein